MGEPLPAAVCRTCRKPLPPDAALRAFCSERCRLSDLGHWFREDFVVSRPLRPEDVPPDPPEEE